MNDELKTVDDARYAINGIEEALERVRDPEIVYDGATPKGYLVSEYDLSRYRVLLAEELKRIKAMRIVK